MDKEFLSSIDRPSVAELRRQAGPAALAFGVWLRVAIAAAGTVVAGLFLAFDDTSSPLLPLALVLGGSVLAVTSWRRAVRILDAADDVTPIHEASLPSRAVLSTAHRVEPNAT